MLRAFQFKNIRSFKDAVYMGCESPVTVICGNNSSGKSNVCYAFKKMFEYVTDSFNFGGEGCKNAPSPFLFDKKSAESNSTLAMGFSIPSDTENVTYEYGFAVDQNGVIRSELLATNKEQSYKYVDELVRNDTYVDECGGAGTSSISDDDVANINTALEKETLALSMGSKLKVDICKKVRRWFADNITVDQKDVQCYNVLVPTDILPDGFVSDPDIRQKLVEFMVSFGFDMQLFDITEWEEGQYVVSVGHKKIDCDEIKFVILCNESDGFKKIFLLYKYIAKVLQSGNVLFVDDLDANLDQNVLKRVVDMFLDSNVNKNGAQLIFTSHEKPVTINKALKGCKILVAEKGTNGVSILKHTRWG